MLEPIARDEQDDLRGKLFEKLAEIGAEKGFSEVEMTQIATDSNRERIEWSVRVVFKRGVRYEHNDNQELCL